MNIRMSYTSHFGIKAIELAELVNSLSNNINTPEALKIDAPLSNVIISQLVSKS
jgi:hypothetical protein